MVFLAWMERDGFIRRTAFRSPLESSLDIFVIIQTVMLCTLVKYCQVFGHLKIELRITEVIARL